MLKLKSVNFEQQDFRDHALEAEAPGQLEWLIGRKPTCDLVLPCPEVSRVHGRILYQDNAYYFVDTGSTGGSLLNGEIIAQHDQRVLNPGDLLQLGKTLIYIQEMAPPTAPILDSTLAIARPHKAGDAAWTTADILCRCCRIVDETPDVKTFYFAAEPPLLFHYLPGQFVTLALEIDGKKVLRPYSISSSPTRPHHLSITVKRVPSPKDAPEAPAGLVSNWLHDHLQVGDSITIMGGPMGNFTCAPDVSQKLLLISAGSGISPMMSMSRWVQDTLIDSDVTFFHSARTVEDLVFRAELEAMASQMSNFHLAVTVTQQLTQQSWMGLTGRISPAMINLVAPDLHDRTVYVCGPDGFMKSTRSLLESLGFPMQNYYEESFGGAPVRKSSPSASTHGAANGAANGAATGLLERNGTVPEQSPPEATSPRHLTAALTPTTITFSDSGQTVSTDGSESILELAEQAGVPIRSACRAGVCGACKVRTNNSQVRYDTQPMALDAADKQAGCVLACVARPIANLVVAA
jgi:glycine betaine catabolism B